MHTVTSTRPHVILVGAGFGGLEATRKLARSAVDVTVIDRHNYHLFQPLLYQVATAALSPADIAEPIRVVLRRLQNATVLLDEVIGVDVAQRRVETCFGAPKTYDYLVLATGSQYTYFGHNDWPRLAPGLKSIDDATLIRRRVLLAFEEAETVTDPAVRQRLLTFVLVGAGPTGVEMAGALAELAHATLSRDFRHINPQTAHILLVEAGPRVLSGFPEKLAAFARRSLKRMGVEILLDTPIEAIDARGVVARGERIEAANVIWCAGVEASPVARWLGAPAGQAGRVIVAPDLSVPGHPEIFVMGDAAFVTGTNGEPVARSRSSRQTTGTIRRRDDRPSRAGRAGAPAVPLSRRGRARHDRPPLGDRRSRLDQPDRLDGLGPLGHRPHLLPDRLPQPNGGFSELDMGLAHLWPRCAADHRRHSPTRFSSKTRSMRDPRRKQERRRTRWPSGSEGMSKRLAPTGPVGVV
jgi:NADH dehydrogenase